MATTHRRQVCANRRKRMLHERRKKVVERRGVFYKHVVEGECVLK